MNHLMERYKTDSLVCSPVTFEQKLRDMIGKQMLESSEGQRDAAVHFAWGHDHDFGTFKLKGKMCTRHIDIMELFEKEIDLKERVKDAHVLDVGCWTGGASLLFAAMGAYRVLAIDEILGYTKCLHYLQTSFGIKNLFTLHTSLFDMILPHRTSFDIVYCAGVLYHLTDPVVGLRIMHNLLRPDGLLLLETVIYRADQGMSLVQYLGPSKTGWNWWFPTVSALKQMLADTGFNNVRRVDKSRGNRVCFVASKSAVVPMMQCGLSRKIT